MKTYKTIKLFNEGSHIYLNLLKLRDAEVSVSVKNMINTCLVYPPDWHIKGYNCYEYRGIGLEVYVILFSIRIHFCPFYKKVC